MYLLRKLIICKDGFQIMTQDFKYKTNLRKSDAKCYQQNEFFCGFLTKYAIERCIKTVGLIFSMFAHITHVLFLYMFCIFQRAEKNICVN